MSVAGLKKNTIIMKKSFKKSIKYYNLPVVYDYSPVLMDYKQDNQVYYNFSNDLLFDKNLNNVQLNIVDLFFKKKMKNNFQSIDPNNKDMIKKLTSSTFIHMSKYLFHS